MQDLDVACSWSSGKDSCFACYKAMKNGYKVRYLLNFISQEFKRVSFHGVWHELVGLQSQALAIPLLQKEVPTGQYEKTFRQSLRNLKSEGITTLIAGDIFLLDCRNWVEDVCKEEGFKVIEPLWGISSKEILKEFVKTGFKATVTATDAKSLNEDWVGRVIDKQFIEDLEKLKTIDLCGEHGEYHTFVFDGPFFKQKIEIQEAKKIFRENYWFLDIQKYKLSEKQENEK